MLSNVPIILILSPQISCNQYIIIIEFGACEVNVSDCYTGNGIESGDLSRRLSVSM